MRSTAQCATLACVFEASAPKVGNVHRGADFEDMTYLDLVTAAVAMGPAFDAGPGARGTRTSVRLSWGHRGHVRRGHVQCLLRDGAFDRSLGSRTARPTPGRRHPRRSRSARSNRRRAGLRGHPASETGRIRQGPTGRCRRTSARRSRGRDAARRRPRSGRSRNMRMASQPCWARSSLGCAKRLSPAIRLPMRSSAYSFETMSRYPDSLIARKCGPAIARQSADHAAHVLALGQPGDEAYQPSARRFRFLASRRRPSPQPRHDGRSDRRGALFGAIARRSSSRRPGGSTESASSRSPSRIPT